MRLIAFTILILAAALLMGAGAITGSYRTAFDVGGWMLFFSTILLLLELTIQGFWKQARDAVSQLWSDFNTIKPDGRCPKCKYDLRGNPAAVTCPECGEPLPPVVRPADTRRSDIA